MTHRSVTGRAIVQTISYSSLFVGREEEVRILERELESLRDGSLHIVMISGEAGSGKTRLLQEFAQHVVHRSIPLFEAACYRTDSPMTLGPWVSALDHFARTTNADTLRRVLGDAAGEIARHVYLVREILPEIEEKAELSLLDARLRLFDSFSKLLANRAVDAGLVILFDDLQWADEASLRLLSHIKRDAWNAPILFVGSYRDEAWQKNQPLRDTLGELATGRSFLHLPLQPIPTPDIRKFVAAAIPRPVDASLAAEIARRSEGNALFMVELTREVISRKGKNSGFASLPVGIRESVLTRFSEVSPSCRNLLMVAAVAGPVMEREILLRSMEPTDDHSACLLLQESVDANFLNASDPGTVRFTHILIQETILHVVPQVTRPTLHSRVARAMEESHCDDASDIAGPLFDHLTRGIPERDGKRLTRYATMAARSFLSRYAPLEACALLSRALHVRKMWGCPEDGGRAALLQLRGHARALAGDGKARDDNVTAFDLYMSLGMPKAAIDVALSRSHRGAWDTTGIPTLRRRALAIVERGSREEGWLLSHGSERDVRRALAIARQTRDKRLEMWVLAQQARAACYRGSWMRSKNREAQALRLAEQLSDARSLHFCHYWRKYRCWIVGETQEAWDSISILFDNARRISSRRMLIEAHHAAARGACAQGDWTKCIHHAEQSLMLQSTDETTFSRYTSQLVLAMTRLQTAPFTTRRDAVTTIRRLSEGVLDPAAMAKIAYFTGEMEEGNNVEPPDPDAPDPFEFTRMSALCAASLCAVVARDAAKATRCLQSLSRWPGLFIPTGPEGKSTDALIGLLLKVLGRDDEAVPHLERAVAFCRRANYRPELAWCCFDYALALGGDRTKKDQAESALLEAEKTARALGLTLLLEKVKRHQQTNRKGESSWFDIPQITRREQEILRLIARGLTNKEIADRLFVSPFTVKRHIQNIYEKAGLSNRVEATTFAEQRGYVR